MAATERREPHELQVTKYRRFSPLLSSVSGLRQVLQVTYSTVMVRKGDIHTERDRHTDVSSKDVLELLLLETTLDNQTSGTVDTSTGTQFGEQELHNVVV